MTDDARAAAIQAIDAFEAAKWSDPTPAYKVGMENRTEFLKARADLIRAILALDKQGSMPRVVTRGVHVYIVYLKQETEDEAGDDWAVEHEMILAAGERRYTWRLLMSGVGACFNLDD